MFRHGVFPGHRGCVRQPSHGAWPARPRKAQPDREAGTYGTRFPHCRLLRRILVWSPRCHRDIQRAVQHIARRFATMDHISGGRIGWNLVTSQIEDEGGNFGFDDHVDHALRYDRAAEFYEVVAGLWDSWEEDAFLYDKAAGVYYDVDRLHFLRHKGRFFDVRGPLNVSRTPQGRPVVAQAGSSETGRELAARTADVVFTAQTELCRCTGFLRRREGQDGALWAVPRRCEDHAGHYAGDRPHAGRGSRKVRFSAVDAAGRSGAGSTGPAEWRARSSPIPTGWTVTRFAANQLGQSAAAIAGRSGAEG